MQITRLSIPDVILLEPKVFTDERGMFFEAYNQKTLDILLGNKLNFVQDNHSKSVHNVLRGLHMQIAPKAQAKIIRVIHGEIYDVAVDLRPNSTTFGKWVCEILSAENKKQLFIPAGFAHGFLTLSNSAEIIYKTNEFYSPEHEYNIIWNDPNLNIQWPCKEPLLSPKDSAAQSFIELSCCI